jgi:Protein of unknown function (DUF3108)
MTPRLTALAFLAALALPLPALAEPVQFDLQVRGIRAGTLTFEGSAEAGRYAVTGRLESSGLVGLLRKIRYDGQAQGRIAEKRFTPARYVERADTGKRQSEAVMEYRSGVPQVKVYNPPRAPGDGGLDPARQGGTVDPLTAMFATLRDVPAGQECDLALTLFDGKRRSQITLAPPQPREGGATCPGEYRRLDGFPAEDMAEKSRFPFTVHLVPGPDGMMRVAEVTMESLYGNARLKRR